MNKQHISQQLSTLKTEYAAGEKMLAELRGKQMNLEETLLRISGAIQVLEELVEESSTEESPVTELPLIETDDPSVVPIEVNSHP